MTTTTVGALGLSLVGRGELAGTWDVPVNDNFRLIEQSTSGYYDIGTISEPYTLPATGTTTDPSKAQVIKLVSTSEGALVTMPNPNTTGYSKTYFIINAGTKSVTIAAGAQASAANVPGNSMSTVVVTRDNARSDTSNAVFGNTWTLAAPGNTAWMKLIGSTGGGNANAFIGFYTGDLSSSTLRATTGYAGTTDYTIDSYDNVIIKSTKTASQGVVTVGGLGATLTGNGTSHTLTLAPAFGSSSKATMTYDSSSDNFTLQRLTAPILNATSTATTLFKNGAALLSANASSTVLFSGASGATAAFISGTGCSVQLKGQDSYAPSLSASTDALELYRVTTGAAVPVLQAFSGEHSFRSPTGAPVIVATSTTTTINAGNGAPAISISSPSSTNVTLLNGARISGDFSNTTINSRTLVQSNVSNSVTRFDVIPNGTSTTATVGAFNNSDPTNAGWVRLTATASDVRVESTVSGSGTALPLRFYTSGLSRVAIGADGDVAFANGITVGASATASNFYGNGFNLTQLNASNVVNGLLPSNIFPATISASTITFSGAHIAKGGTAYNLLDITSTASILRDSAGNDVFNASTAALALKRANNIVLNASSTATQLFNHAASIRVNFDASISQIFSPATTPFISATTTTTTISAGNGTQAISIDADGNAETKRLNINSGNAGFFTMTASNDAATFGSINRATGTAIAYIGGGNGGAVAGFSANDFALRAAVGKLILSAAESVVISGVAYDVQTVNGVGSLRLMKNISGSTVNSGATVAGSGLYYVYGNAAGILTAVSASPSGTWKNITGMNCASGDSIEWLRIN
jgi:hypothetical protein